jgi:hypothetical protein
MKRISAGEFGGEENSWGEKEARMRFREGNSLVHVIQLGALCAGALFKVPLKVLIWGILNKVPLIHHNLGHFG